MTTWILTTGNSDIQLTTKDNWLDFCDPIWDQLYDNVVDPSPIEDSDYYTAPARILGYAYQSHLEKAYKDLYFPLLDGFCEYLEKNNITPTEIIYFISDQSQIFPEGDRYSLKCPYWKDTITLQPIFEYYLQQKFPNATLTPKILEPKEGENGLENWDKTLTLIQQVLGILNINKNKPIYISHQAGTPAMSSALQFVSLANFGDKVKFLVSNEYDSKVEILPSSRYLRGLKIEQAKGLIANAPGAAKKLLTDINDINPEKMNELTNIVNFFNLNRVDYSQDEFSIEAATQRIVDALDLIGILFSQENYLEGIGLLSAAHETFLKIAILNTVNPQNINNFNGNQIIEWNQEGLMLTSFIKRQSINQQNQALAQLSFPVDQFSVTDQNKNNFNKTNSNSVMLRWLQRLKPDFRAWAVLVWSCNHYRNREQDLRNQLMHNLIGISQQDVIDYLLGYPSQPSNLTDIMQIYNEQVKTQFFAAINLLQLPYTREKLVRTLTDLANSLQ
jgi:hypothetical protein